MCSRYIFYDIRASTTRVHLYCSLVAVTIDLLFVSVFGKRFFFGFLLFWVSFPPFPLPRGVEFPQGGSYTAMIHPERSAHANETIVPGLHSTKREEGMGLPPLASTCI